MSRLDGAAAFELGSFRRRNLGCHAGAQRELEREVFIAINETGRGLAAGSMTSSEDRIRALPIWNGRISVEPLKGGLSNESWIVSDAAGRHVVRFGRDYPFHHVARDREAMVARAAHAAGFAPEVRHAAPGVLVTAYLGAQTYGAEDVRKNAGRVADLIRRFHRDMPAEVSGPGFMFWVFHVIRDYRRTLEGAGRPLDALRPHLAAAEAWERVQVPLPIVFGHNDLLPANFLDDGERLWLIDFEYAGFSTATFDLAGLSSNAGFDEGESDALLRDYLGRPPSGALKRSLMAMQAASLLRETLWALVSARFMSAPGVDYEAYARENQARLDAAFHAYRSAYGCDP